MSRMLALRSLGSSGALTRALGTLDAAVLAALPRDAGDEGPPPGSPLLHSELLPELSRVLTAAGAGRHLGTTFFRHNLVFSDLCSPQSVLFQPDKPANTVTELAAALSILKKNTAAGFLAVTSSLVGIKGFASHHCQGCTSRGRRCTSAPRRCRSCPHCWRLLSRHCCHGTPSARLPGGCWRAGTGGPRPRTPRR